MPSIEAQSTKHVGCISRVDQCSAGTGTIPGGNRMTKEQRTVVNGVFKGGGAKGAAYAGALRAAVARGIEFKSVAGASAGAITASLIAAGYGTDTLVGKLDKLTTDGLKAVKPDLFQRAWYVVTGRSRSLLESRGLELFLDATFCDQIREPGSDATGPVTFAEMFAATEIGLYIVTMDLATRGPIVFHHRLTPDASVAAAVAASSAIPGIFPARRVSVADDGKRRIDVLVDGGSWANFPTFVYTDADFRNWFLKRTTERGTADSATLAAESADEGIRHAIGFTLDAVAPADDAPPIAAPKLLTNQARPHLQPDSASVEFLDQRAEHKTDRRFDAGTSESSGSPLGYLLARVLGNDAARVFAAAVLAIAILLGRLLWPVGVREVNQRVASLPGWAWALSTAAVMFALALLAVLAIVLFTALLAAGRVLSDTLLPALTATMGVATGVAPWEGHDPKMTRIDVPAPGLTTTSFSVPDGYVKDVVAYAEGVVATQLALAQLGAERLPTPPGQGSTPKLPAKRDFVRISVGLVAVFLIGCAISWLMRASGFQPALLYTGGGIALACVIGVGRIFHSTKNAHDRAFRRIGPSGPFRYVDDVRLRMGVGLMVLIAVVPLSAWLSDGERQYLVRATIVGGQRNDPPINCIGKATKRPYTYDFKGSWLDPNGHGDQSAEFDATFCSKASLAIGSRVLVRDETCDESRTERVPATCKRQKVEPKEMIWGLAEKTGAARGLVPLGVVVVGSALLLSGIKEWRWRRRAKILARVG